MGKKRRRRYEDGIKVVNIKPTGTTGDVPVAASIPLVYMPGQTYARRVKVQEPRWVPGLDRTYLQIASIKFRTHEVLEDKYDAGTHVGCYDESDSFQIASRFTLIVELSDGRVFEKYVHMDLGPSDLLENVLAKEENLIASEVNGELRALIKIGLNSSRDVPARGAEDVTEEEKE